MTPLWIIPSIPAAGAATVLSLRRHPRTLGPAALVSLVLTLAVAIAATAHPESVQWQWSDALTGALAVAGPGRFMIVLVPTIAIPVVWYAATSGERDTARLVALLLAFTGAMELLVLADDLLLLLIGWELVGACSWGLITHQWDDPERPRAARDAFITTRTGDLGLYIAAAVLLTTTGSLRFESLPALTGTPAAIAAAGLLIAAAAKSAQLPFAPWLFRAMLGPTPASALLHSATMVAAGAYALVRLAPLLPGAPWLGPATMIVGLSTALAGGVVATLQMDLKRALAGSTSAQYGLMFVAIGAGFPAAADEHLIAHAAFKALLFLGAGIAMHAAGTLDLRHMQLGRQLPATATLVAVGALALAAVPPLGGAYTKEQIVAAATTAGPWITTGVITAGALSALYAARLFLLSYGPGARTAHPPGRTPPRSEVCALAVLATISIALGVLWIPGVSDALTRWIGQPIAPEPAIAIRMLPLFATAGAIGIAWLLWRHGSLARLGVPEAIATPVAAWLGLPLLARIMVVHPVTALARTLAGLDARVVDAGIRATGGIAAALSRILGWWSERGFDGIVEAIARATGGAARTSSIADTSAMDAAVEELANGIGATGRRARMLQTGLTHQYYVVVAAGVALVAAIALLRRL